MATLCGVAAGYGGAGAATVLREVDLRLDTSDRVALLGDNGAGKSTLLRLLLGEVRPARGDLHRNDRVTLGVMRQNLEGLFSERVLLDNFRHCPVSSSEVRVHLGAAGLRRERVLLPVAALSVGERMRAALVRLVLERSEFLLLDEPTSHLDLESIEVLEAMLRGFAGGFLLVSHDRRLVERVAERVWLLRDGRLDQV